MPLPLAWQRIRRSLGARDGNERYDQPEPGGAAHPEATRHARILASAAHGRVAFTAPIARAILGRGVGDIVALDTPRGQDRLQVMSIDYPADLSSPDGAT